MPARNRSRAPEVAVITLRNWDRPRPPVRGVVDDQLVRIVDAAFALATILARIGVMSVSGSPPPAMVAPFRTAEP